MRSLFLAFLLALGPAVHAQMDTGEAASHGTLMRALAEAYPTFAGWYVGPGVIHVNATGPIDGPGVVAYLDRLSGGSYGLDPAARVDTQLVPYTYVQLDAWLQALVRGAPTEVAAYLSTWWLDERANRLTLGFREGLTEAAIEAWLQAQPVPRDAVFYRWGGVLHSGAPSVPRRAP